MTLALANGRSESWISDRTGHRNPQMIARYKLVERVAEPSAAGVSREVARDRSRSRCTRDRAPCSTECYGVAPSTRLRPNHAGARPRCPRSVCARPRSACPGALRMPAGRSRVAGRSVPCEAAQRPAQPVDRAESEQWGYGDSSRARGQPVARLKTAVDTFSYRHRGERPMSPTDHIASNTAGRREGPSSLRQQLKRETAALHQRLEAQLGLLDPALSLQPIPSSAPSVLRVLRSRRSQLGAPRCGCGAAARLSAACALRADRA